jgi:hypothetical protein
VDVAKLELVDGQGKVLTNPSLSQTEPRSLKITAKNLQAFRRVEVTLDNGLAVITPQSAALTNEGGVALFTIAPASISSSGVVRVSAKLSVDTAADVTNSLDLQVAPGDVSLGGLLVAPTSVQIGQSITVSVNALVDGAAARRNAVSVTFSTSCGTVTPATAPVDSAGVATAVIQTKVVGMCVVQATADRVIHAVVFHLCSSRRTSHRFEVCEGRSSNNLSERFCRRQDVLAHLHGV